MSYISLLRFRRLEKATWRKTPSFVPPSYCRFVTSGNVNSPSKCLSYPGKPKHSSSYQAIIIGGGDFYRIHTVVFDNKSYNYYLACVSSALVKSEWYIFMSQMYYSYYYLYSLVLVLRTLFTCTRIYYLI